MSLGIVASAYTAPTGGGGAISNPTLISSGQSAGGAGTGTYTTGSLTIPSSCLLIVHAGVMIDGGSTDPSAAITVTASLGGITLTPILPVGNAASWSIGMASWVANVTTGGSSTFTFDCGAFNVYQYIWSVAYVTGHNTSTPIGAADDTATTAPGSNLTLDTAPASTSLIVASIVADNGPVDAATPGSGWTQTLDIRTGGGGPSLFSMYRPPGSTATSVLVTVNGAGKAIGQAFEILAA